jgi:hypothetical protein
VVTAKGSASTGDTWRTFRPHLLWAAVSLAAIASGLALDHHYPTLHFWAALATLICLAPIAHVAINRLTSVEPHTVTPSPIHELSTVSLPDPRPELVPAEPVVEARQ